MSKKIIFYNLVLIFVIFIIFEIIFIFKSAKIENVNIKNYKIINIPKERKYNNFFDENPNENPRCFIGENYKNKQPILLIGCSFAYSYGLETENSLGYKLSHYLKRPVYMRAIPAGGPNEALYIFRQKEFYKTIKEPEYIIYLFIQDHFNRISSYIYSIESPYLRPMFNINDDFQAKDKKCFYKPLFMNHIFKYYYRDKIFLKNKPNEEEFLKIMGALKKEANKTWPKTKLIVLRYSEGTINKPFLFSNKFINKLKENNIIYIDADEIVYTDTKEKMIGKKYMLEDDHPNAYAFEILSKNLAKEINKL